jgi:uncharacterized protein (DUF2062 family)
MALSNDKKAMLKQWAAAGDIMAVEALALEATGRGGLVSLGAPAAPAVAVHAAIAATTPITPVTTGLTNPAQPRNLAVVFGSGWDGGDVIVKGTDQFGASISETFLTGSAVTRVGNKVFKTVTSVEHTAVGTTQTYTVQTGSKLGLLFDVLDTMGLGLVQATPGAANTPEAVTVDPTYNSVLFTTAPDGTKVLCLVCNL